MKQLRTIIAVSFALVGCVGCAPPAAGGPAAPAEAPMMLRIIAPSTVVHGTTSSLAAYAINSDGTQSDMTAAVAWSSSDASVAIVVDNKLATVGPGSATLTATLGAARDSITITVVPKQIVALMLEADSESASIGASRAWIVLARYNDGSDVDVTASATWSSSNPSVAVVGEPGWIDAVGAGDATIAAEYSGDRVAGALVVVGTPAR